MAPVVTNITGVRVGQACDLTIEAASAGGQFRSRIEDVAGDRISVTMPSQRGEHVAPANGQQIQIVVQLPNSARMFIQAEVTGRQLQPFPTIHTRVLSVGQQQARGFFRADVQLWPHECSVWTGNQEHGFWRPVRATVSDMSGGGAGLVAHEEIHDGDRVKLRFPLPFGGGECVAIGHVRRAVHQTQGSSRGGLWRVGVAFDELNRVLRDRLVAAVNRVQAEERRRSEG